jgi:hypothetical protein
MMEEQAFAFGSPLGCKQSQVFDEFVGGQARDCLYQDPSKRDAGPTPGPNETST